MRIYEGSPRQDFEEVLRSIGAFIDERGMSEVLLAEAPDGFIVQGVVGTAAEVSAWSEPSMVIRKETYTFLDEDIARFMEDAQARRRSQSAAATPQAKAAAGHAAGPYERTMRVIGRYIDEQKPKDVFFFEQDGAYVLRLLMSARTGARHMLVEFTAEDLASMVAQGPSLRGEPATT